MIGHKPGPPATPGPQNHLDLLGTSSCCRLEDVVRRVCATCKVWTGILQCQVVRLSPPIESFLMCVMVQLLTEMDGFDSETGVLVLAATNRPEVLDPALTRPGRISRRVNVEAPDFAGRQQVLAVHMRAMPVEGDPATLQEVVASKTSGFVGADLANVVNEAAFIAARQSRPLYSSLHRSLLEFQIVDMECDYMVCNGPKIWFHLA